MFIKKDVEEMQTKSNNKRLAKNTMLLYIRMLFNMAISLFTSRIVLKALGVEDFGTYNVVGGFIAMFTALSGSFSSAITRFITFELGKNDTTNLNKVFCTGVNIQLTMSAIILVVSEIAGIWFLNYHMNIPTDRLVAANWVLQCSIGSFVLNLISVPYNAEIIAHERMGAFAAISICDIIMKLLIAYLLLISPFDRLITYAVLFLLVSLITRIAYGLYCKMKFVECHYRLIIDTRLFKEMGKFAGWNFLGSSAFMLNTQGVNILMNMYFGVAVNAARGLAVQVDNAVRSFSNSFMTAINPQIIKSYSAGQREEMNSLVCQGTKYSVFLFLYLAVPIILEAPFILELWLKNVPDHTMTFVRLVVIGSFIDSVMGNAYWVAIMATGSIRKYQISVALVGVMVFPLSWLLFQLGYGPEASYVSYILVYCVVLGVRLYYMKKQLLMPYHFFFKYILLRIVPSIVLAFVLPLPIFFYMDQGWPRLIVVLMSSVVTTSIIIALIGLNKTEQQKILSIIRNKIHRK